MSKNTIYERAANAVRWLIMKNLWRIIVEYFFKGLFVTGFFLMFGVIGGIEQDSITLFQATVLMIVSVVMMYVSYYWEYKDNEYYNNEIENIEKYSA